MYILYQNHQVYPKYLVEYVVRSPNQRHQPYIVQPPRRPKPSTGISNWLRGSSNQNKASKSSTSRGSARVLASKRLRKRTAKDKYGHYRFKPAVDRCKEGHHKVNFKLKWERNGAFPYWKCVKCKTVACDAAFFRDEKTKFVQIMGRA